MFIFLGLLFIIKNKQVMAMNNSHVSPNNGHDNNHINLELQFSILRDLNLQQNRIIQQIFNARNK
ncbi:SVM family protein [Candidatus Phytoplasma ziziphi]|uniref:SVM family protein n=1 Tax=Candidatus Phytoplasma TaxID=33926 RepID=UPI001F18EC7F|nr:SVM family protein [Candidatus Phytoplasma ziziphi]